jgi:LPXTG-motif cell wall-anchored protein
MTVRQKSSTKLITAVLLTALLGLGIAPVEAFGEPVYRKVGESNGLVIEVPEKTQDTGNLGPGDTKQSHIRLTNSNQRSVTVYMRTEIVEESTLYGGKLAEAFRLKIMDGSGTVYDGTFQEAHDKGNISLGRMTPNAEKTLYFYADLPGRETGNEYQGSSMKVQWVFTTQVGGGGGGGGGDEGGRRGGGGGEEEEVIIEEPDVFEPPEEPVTVDYEPPLMPKTGEASPLPFYVAGACAVVLGASLIINKNRS